MITDTIKHKAHQLLDNLPDTATWEDIMYRIYVRESIDAGIDDSNNDRTKDVKDVLAVIHGARLLIDDL